MVNFGEILKELRLQAGLTQKELGEQIKVTKSVISYYELQERYPSPEILLKLADVFNVSVDYLLGRENKQSLDISNLDADEIQLLQHMINVLKNKKNTVLNKI